ncbi:MAG: hypothetical protein V1900_02105 [Candidatus Aenigmatarchaeota archaeon]
MEDDIKKKRKDGWIEVSFMIEVLGVDKDVVENAMKTHIDKLSKTMYTFVYEKKFSDTNKVENPMKNIGEAYSQIAEVKLFIKDMLSLVSVVLIYGPSAIEIIGPSSKEIKIDEMQNICNVLAGLIHQYAAAGIGGVLITPDKPRSD